MNMQREIPDAENARGKKLHWQELVCASSRSWNFRSVEEILLNRFARIFQSSATDWEHASVAMRGAMSRKHVVLNGLQKWNRTTICKCHGWWLGTFSTKRKDDMYTKLKRGKTKAEFPLVSAGIGDEGCLFSAQFEVGGMFSTQRKRWYVRKTEKEKDESGFPLG